MPKDNLRDYCEPSRWMWNVKCNGFNCIHCSFSLQGEKAQLWALPATLKVWHLAFMTFLIIIYYHLLRTSKSVMNWLGLNSNCKRKKEGLESQEGKGAWGLKKRPRRGGSISIFRLGDHEAEVWRMTWGSSTPQVIFDRSDKSYLTTPEALLQIWKCCLLSPFWRPFNTV